ncbi:MAG: hypothetical protein ACRESV_07890, partial [Nevskiales bacterium]
MSSNARPVTLYDSLFKAGAVSRMGDITLMRFDGFGAVVTNSQTFNHAASWAKARQATPNKERNRSMFLDRIDVLITRCGTALLTRGSNKPLVDLTKAMASGGMDLMEWNVPLAVKQTLEEERATLTQSPS